MSEPEAREALTRFEWGRNGVGLCTWCGRVRGTYDADAHENDCPLRVVRAALEATPAPDTGQPFGRDANADGLPDAATEARRELLAAVAGRRRRLATPAPDSGATPPPSGLDGLDVERLWRAMCALDGDEAGVFDIVAISEPDTRPVAEALARYYLATLATPKETT